MVGEEPKSGRLIALCNWCWEAATLLGHQWSCAWVISGRVHGSSVVVLPGHQWPYFLVFYGRTFKGSLPVRPKMLCPYVLGTYGRTSLEGMNDGV